MILQFFFVYSQIQLGAFKTATFVMRGNNKVFVRLLSSSRVSMSILFSNNQKLKYFPPLVKALIEIVEASLLIRSRSRYTQHCIIVEPQCRRTGEFFLVAVGNVIASSKQTRKACRSLKIC